MKKPVALTMLFLELRKYGQDYKKLLCSALTAVIAGTLIILGVNALSERQSLFEPFAVGVVDYDGTAEFKFVLDFFNEAIEVLYLDKADAQQLLAEGKIPAYLEFPENFAADIFRGTNNPFTLYANREFPLQVALSKLLAKSGLAFLTVSQSGIYAALDSASAQGLPADFINSRLVYPVNLGFIKKLLDYQSFFTSQTLVLTGALPVTAHYVLSFAVFWCMLNLLAFLKTVRGYTAGIFVRYQLAGIARWQVQLIRLAGLTCANAAFTLPFLGLAVRFAAPALSLSAALLLALALAFCVSAFMLLTTTLFAHETAEGLFIFGVSLGMLFVSGGVVPLAFLPRTLHGLRYASFHYWVTQACSGTFYTGLAMILAFGLLFLGVVCIVSFLFTGIKHKT